MKTIINGVEYDINLKTSKLIIDYNPVKNTLSEFYDYWTDLYKKEKIKKERQLRVDKLNNIIKNK